MKRVTIDLYEFNELNEQAKQRAINDARGWVEDGQSEIVGDVFHETLDKIEDVFGIVVEEGMNDRFTWHWTDEARWGMFVNFLGEYVIPDDEPRLLPRFFKEVTDRINTMKTYYLPKSKWVEGVRHFSIPKRESKVMYDGYRDCLTGDYGDAIVDEMMTGRWDYVRMGWTISEFIDHLLEGLRNKWNYAYEEMTSDEMIEEMLGNGFREVYYTEDGREWKGIR